MPLARHTQLGPYQILDQLGAGGMGEVYRARDTRLEREVAVKVLLEQRADDPVALARFQREVRAIAGVSHPNILVIFDVGVADGVTFAVTELLRGETLRDRLKRGSLPWKRAAATATAIANGLAAAHSKRIIHRDIKPENIFLTADDGLKILDFGLARNDTPNQTLPAGKKDDSTLVTQKGVVMGTVAYMSPEQVRGEPADTRSDVFAFGCVLYEMITGRHPFLSATNVATMATILFDPVPDLGDGGDDRPEGLDSVVLQCLEKDPAKRFRSAVEICAALKDLDRGGHKKSVESLERMETALPFEPAPSPNRESATSVAVLPFRTLSPDKEDEYFSDGLVEELVDTLNKVEGLRVASRTSAFAFKGKNDDVRKIGQQLNVAAILEGSVRRAGNNVRVSAQLVNVADGFELWSETYNRELTDAFPLQEELARRITEAARSNLGRAVPALSQKKSAANIKAAEFCARGWQFCRQFRRKGFEYASIMFRRAAAVDSNCAEAFAGEAICQTMLYEWWDADFQRVRQAENAAANALSLQPDLAEAHAGRALAQTLTGLCDQAEQSWQKAIDYQPDSFLARYYYGQALMRQSHYQEAANQLERACEIEPKNIETVFCLAEIRFRLREQAEAVAAAHECLEMIRSHLALHPDEARAVCMGAIMLSRQKERTRALEWADQAREMDPDEPFALCQVARVFAVCDETHKALDCLERALQLGFAAKAWIEQESDFAALHDEPRFQRMFPLADTVSERAVNEH